jgi:hypothetical protein
MIRKARPSSRPTSALPGTGAAGRAGISRVDLWSTDKMPIDNSDAAAELQRKGFVVRHNYVGSGQGSVCRVVEFAGRRAPSSAIRLIMPPRFPAPG